MGGKVLTEAEGRERSFEGLKVLGWAGKTKRNHRLWKVLCRCGATFEAEMDELAKRKKVSCGCVRTANLLQQIALSKKHGVACSTAPSSLKRTWAIWVGMWRRCTDVKCKAYKHYGGRGIKVHPLWADFNQFLADVGEAPAGHSIERVGNDGDYSPGNCIWLPSTEQAKNRRSSIRLRLAGVEMCLKDACSYLGLTYMQVFKRIRYRGVPVHVALNLPSDRVTVVQMPALQKRGYTNADC